MEAVNILSNFSTSYLCELGFSALTRTKNMKLERLVSAEQKISACLSVCNSTTNRTLVEETDKLKFPIDN